VQDSFYRAPLEMSSGHQSRYDVCRREKQWVASLNVGDVAFGADLLYGSIRHYHKRVDVRWRHRTVLAEAGHPGPDFPMRYLARRQSEPTAARNLLEWRAKKEREGVCDAIKL